ncbi:Rrf2 family transcriptional regulator [Candidatus Sumerlaeota bacterium]|nr:Rrf2 family transcriptional regulator [Candidatus Sumerlaeota bacterium]
MSKILNFSDAASLAMHTAVFLASAQAVREPEPLTVSRIASTLDASEAHLSKVLQRLGKAGIVISSRGPRGGFVLARPADKITLLEVYEAIEGAFVEADCLLRSPVCQGASCILGRLLRNVNGEVRQYLEKKNLSDLTGVYG